MSGPEVDPATMALDELRTLRAQLQHDEDAVSYVRRLTQGRLDLVRAQLRRVHGDDHAPITQELPAILAHNVGGVPARPPRPTADFSDHPLAAELDELDARVGGGENVEEMDDEALHEYDDALSAFERARSQERRDLFARIDRLSAELVRRYRIGEADVDGLLAQD